MPKIKTVVKSDFYCTECGLRGIPIARKNYQLRESGHLKKIYCLHCKKETNHVEIRPYGSSYTYQDFLLEFELGRYVDGRKKGIGELPLCSKFNCQYNVNGRCWNTNESFTGCSHRPRAEK